MTPSQDRVEPLPLTDISPQPGGPPRRSKIAAAVAACSACCVLPLFVATGLLTGGAVVARESLIVHHMTGT